MTFLHMQAALRRTTKAVR